MRGFVRVLAERLGVIGIANTYSTVTPGASSHNEYDANTLAIVRLPPRQARSARGPSSRVP